MPTYEQRPFRKVGINVKFGQSAWLSVRIQMSVLLFISFEDADLDKGSQLPK
jgi:hypothetical protein